MKTGKRERGRGKRWLLLTLLAGGCGERPPDALAVVDTMMDRGAEAWNRGDFEAFVGDYAPESTTTFVSGGRVQHGFEWIRQNYAPVFAPDAARDSLRFESLEGRALDDDYLLATARYVLFRGDSVTSSGPFTLVLKRISGRWKIIHDHTSRD